MKEYAKREDVEKHTICECGHADFQHETLGLFTTKDGECNECTCPKFKKEQELTIKELAKLWLFRMGYPAERLNKL